MWRICVYGYLELVAASLLYGLGVVAQSVAARRAENLGVGMGLLGRLVSDRLYLLGFAGQVSGFVLAFFCRATLPLYLVQAGSSAAVGWAALFGTVVLGWRIRRLEVVTLLMMALGLVLLVAASTPSTARQLPGSWWVVLVAVLLTGVVVLGGIRSTAVLPMAALSGVAFSVVAIAGRSLANLPLTDLPWHPLTWLMLVSALVGQAAMAVALRRGSATSAVASIDAVTVIVVSIVGLVALDDRIAPGRQWWVALGLGLVLAGVFVLGSSSHGSSRRTPVTAEAAT
jgi:drug/metabolite transporter (DMT)-like permease